MILSFRKFNKSHTAENIAIFINKEISKLDLVEKVVSITTDNEPAVVAACKKLSKEYTRISCMCHNLNLVVKNGFKLWSKAKR